MSELNPIIPADAPAMQQLRLLRAALVAQREALADALSFTGKALLRCESLTERLHALQSELDGKQGQERQEWRRIVIGGDEAAMSMIAELRSQRVSWRQVANSLNAAGLRTSRGLPWKRDNAREYAKRYSA
jgi:hypothetical protein